MSVTKESSLFQRVASGGQETVAECISMLRSYGYDAPQSRQELAYMLADCSVKNGEAVLKQIAEFHPDKDFILHNIVVEVPALPAKKLNDCGCGGSHNDTGNPAPASVIMQAPGTQKKSLEPTDIAMMLGFTVLSLGICISFILLISKVFQTK